MNIDRQVNLWDRAQIARSSANWSLLLQCLGQLIEEGDGREVRGFAASASPIPSLKNPKQAKLLVWAMDVLEFGDFHQRWDIAKLLPKLGKSTYGLGVTEVIAPLIEVLEDEDADEELRWFSIRILGKFNHPDVITVLVELLKTSDTEEKAIAAQALAEIGASAVVTITGLLAQEETRLLAVRSLSYIRHSETITPLLGVAQDPQIEIRAAAIEALSSFHDSRVAPVLLNALNDVAAMVRREAVIGLSFRPDLQEELDLVNRLLPRLYDFNLDVCLAAAIALGRIGTDAAAAGLFNVLQSPHTPLSLQIEIVRALGRVGTEISLEYLRSSLYHLETSAVWQEIALVLGRIEQSNLKPKAAQILIELLQSNHSGLQQATIKQAIALSLGQLGQSEAIYALIQLLADADIAVRLHAIAALKQLNAEFTYHKLKQMSSNTTLAPQLQQGIAIALQEWSIQ